MSSTSGSTASVMHKVVISRDLGSEVMALLKRQPNLDVVVWPENHACDRRWLLDNIAGAAGLLVNLTDVVNEELLEKAGSRLRVVSTMSVGYEHMELAALAKRGLRLGYTPDVLNDAVADLSVMLALMAGRNDGESLTIVKEGKWPQFSWSPFSFCGPQLSATLDSPTKKVGFLGFGRIAQATLARLIPFGVTHCLYTRRPTSLPKTDLESALIRKYQEINPKFQTVKQVALDELARESDVVFVLAPGGEATRHVINEDFLKKMKKTSVIVNTSRGTLVDSDALAKALKEGWIWGAGLDVVEGENNIRSDHPLVGQPRCVMVPHIGSATFETRLDMATLAVRNLLAGVFDDSMPSEVNLKSLVVDKATL